MQVQRLCFNEFPDQCEGCSEYTETMQDSATELMWLAGTGIVYPLPYISKVVKECKRYHKRKVEYLR